MKGWIISGCIALLSAAGCGGKAERGGGSETGFSRCRDSSDCAQGQSCVDHACVSEALQRRDAGLEPGAGGTIDASPAVPDPASFADVYVPVDFTEPVALPPPEIIISGDASKVVGSWIELSATTGEPCSTCRHLDIEPGPNGGYVGTFYEVVAPGAPAWGPFAPADDPDTGYPVEIVPKHYASAAGFIPRVNYRIFDGQVDGNQFTFWVSGLDLWADWCSLQRPFAWDVSGRREHHCVPQTASEADTDLGKLVLCTAAGDGPQCKDENGVSMPCVCLDDSKRLAGSVLCSIAYCECSERECHANWRTGAVTARFELIGDTLRGPFMGNALLSGETTFVRVSP